jgi:hypothetical protein
LSDSASRRLPFTSRQLATLVVIGVVIWLLGALLLNYLGEIGSLQGASLIIVYAALIPGTVPIILLVRRLARLATDQIALASAIVVASAIVLDGLALSWFPALYGPGIAQTAVSGAIILWGGGVAIALGCLFNRVPPQ